MDNSKEDSFVNLDDANEEDDSFVNLDYDDDVSFSNMESFDGSESETSQDVESEVEDEDEDADLIYPKFKTYIDLTKEDIMLKDFASEDDVYKFYYTYAKFNGFAIRKDELHYWPNGEIKTRQLVCNKAGLRHIKHFMRDDRKRDHRPLSRTNCKARLRVKFHKETSRWKVVSFWETHNHVLCEPNYVPLINLYRGLTDADKAQIDSLHAQGVRTCQIMGFMMDQKGGHVGVGFNKKDLFNYIERQRRSKIKDGDVLAALSYLHGKADNDPMFFSRYVVSEDGKLRHLFWADGTSRTDFQCFGDVVAFDSTYKKNKYNKPMVIFSGKNHHSETVIFGCALVSDETIDSYKWVLQTFLDAMCNKHPKSVVTDGDCAMREAIREVFPDATHRLCAWHLLKNACEHVKDPQFLDDFKRAMFANITPDRFENFWKEMVDKNQLEGNSWVSQLYQKKLMWATAYLRDKFFAGLRTTSICEGVNSMIKTYIGRKNTIVELLYNFEHSLRDYRYKELISDFNSLYTNPLINSSLPMVEEHASKIYTRGIFNKVKSQIVNAGGLNVIERIDSVEKVMYKVEKYRHRRSQLQVVFDKHEEKFQCECMMYESIGIPCCHIICAMRLDHVNSFPPSLICNRWLKDAKSEFISCYQSENIDNDMMTTTRVGVLAACCNRLCEIAGKRRDSFNFIRNEILKLTNALQQQGFMNSRDNGAVNDVFDPNVVNSKGAPRRKNVRKNRKCSNCKKSGHNVTTCPVLFCMDDEIDVSDDSYAVESNDRYSIKAEESLSIHVSDNQDDAPTHQSRGNTDNKRRRKASGRDRMKDEKEKSGGQKLSKDKSQVDESLSIDKRRRKVSGRDRMKDEKEKSGGQKLSKDKSKFEVTDSGSNEGKDVNPNWSTQKSITEIRPIVPFSAEAQQIRPMANVIPTQQNYTFPFTAYTQGMPLHHAYGLVPFYPQFHTVPQFCPIPPAPDPNIMPMNYNMNGVGQCYDLLQQVMKGGKSTERH